MVRSYTDGRTIPIPPCLSVRTLLANCEKTQWNVIIPPDNLDVDRHLYHSLFWVFEPYCVLSTVKFIFELYGFWVKIIFEKSLGGPNPTLKHVIKWLKCDSKYDLLLLVRRQHWLQWFIFGMCLNKVKNNFCWFKIVVF